MSKRWFNIEAKASTGAVQIRIYNDIGDYGLTASDFADALDGAGEPKSLDIRISSNGGDVSTGFAIFNMLERHAARKVITVDGLAASMASVIAMAGDEIHMPENSMMMIHNPWGAVMGGAEQIHSFGDALDQMQAQIVDAYVARTGLKRDEVQTMMNRETWLSAKKAVSLGFADNVGEALAVQAAFDVSRFHRVPKAFKAANERLKTMTKKAKDVVESESDDTGYSAQTPEQIRKAVLAHSREIRSLCNLAGFPKMADKLIEEDKSLSEVIVALDKAKSDAGKGSKAAKAGTSNEELDSHNNGRGEDKPAAEINPRQIYANWNKSKK